MTNKIVSVAKSKNLGYCAEKGLREYMEDRQQVMHFKIDGKAGVFYGVFDGHGGKDVANYLVNSSDGLFPYLITAIKLNANKKPLVKVIKTAYLEYDEKLFKMGLKAGSTATVILRYDDMVHLINLGDSRCLFFTDKDGNDLKVSVDHKPWQVRERNRIFKAGYFVNPFKVYDNKSVKKNFDNGDICLDNKVGKAQMFLSNSWATLTTANYNQIKLLNSNVDTHRVCNSLALSRAFGDFYLKVNNVGKYMGINAAVSPSPDIISINVKALKGKRGYVFLASDGFFDVIRINTEFLNYLTDNPNISQELCKMLVKMALDKGTTDNVTVMYDNFII